MKTKLTIFDEVSGSENYCPLCNGRMDAKQLVKTYKNITNAGKSYYWLFSCQDCNYSEKRITSSDSVIQGNIILGIKESLKRG